MNLKVKFNHPEDTPLQSSLNEIQSFGKGLVWGDIKTIISEQIEERQMELEKADSIEDVRFIQGQLRVWRLLLELPDMLEVWKTDQEGESDG